MRRGAAALLLGLLAGQALAAGFAFGVNGLDFSLSRYRVQDDGSLRHLGHLPLDKATPAVAIHPSGEFVLVPSKTASNIAVFRLDRHDGELAPVAGSPFPAQATSPFAVIFHPSGRYVYAAARFSGVAGYAFDLQSGALTPLPGSPYVAGERTRALVMHPSGHFVYAVNGYSNTLSAYAVDPATGVLSPLPGSPFPVSDGEVIDYRSLGMADVPPTAGGIPYDVAMDPAGRFLYVANWAAASVSGFRLDARTGVPRPMAGSPFYTGFNPYRLRVHPSGRWLYVAQYASAEIAAHAIDAESGALMPLPGSPFPSGAKGPVALTFSADGHRLYVSHYDANAIVLHTVDPPTGALRQGPRLQTRPGPWDLALAEDLPTAMAEPRLLGVQEGRAVMLEVVGATPAPRLPAASRGRSLVTGPHGRFAYLAEGGRVTTLALSAKGAVPVAGGVLSTGHPVRAMAVDVNGWYLYTVNDDDTLLAYAIDRDSGIPRSIQRAPVRTGRGPQSVTLDPAARYAFVVNTGDDSVDVFRYLDSRMPLLIDSRKYGSPFATGKHPTALAVTPDGRYAFVANAGDDDISAYGIHHQTGALSALPGSPFATGHQPVGLVVHPSGRWLLVASSGEPEIRLHAIETELGALGAGRKFALPAPAKTLRLDVEGKSLWVLSQDGRRLWHYAFDSAKGQLQRLGERVLSRPMADLAWVAVGESRK